MTKPMVSKRKRGNKICTKCGNSMYCNTKKLLCRQCLSVCECGKEKDFRAINCISCGMSKKAKAQWQQPNVSQKMREGLIIAGAKRRRKFEDLNEGAFCNKRLDGRIYAHYWDNERRHTIYYYQWLWLMAGSDIPKGSVIHHKDGNHLNNDLSNLELLTASAHATHHGLTKPKAEWICQYCKKKFAMQRREGYGARKFCGHPCHYAYVREFTVSGTKCRTFEAANDFTKALPAKV